MTTSVAIVTGAARGIGAAIAARLHRAGHAVASLDLLTPDTAREGVLDLACDLAEADAVDAAVARVRAQLGAPSILVHAAAFQHQAAFDRLDTDDWQRTFRVNVDGTFHLVRAALPDLRAAGSCLKTVGVGTIIRAGRVHE